MKKTSLDKFSSQKIDTKEMDKVEGGNMAIYFGSNSIGEYVWRLDEDGQRYGYYTSYYD